MPGLGFPARPHPQPNAEPKLGQDERSSRSSGPSIVPGGPGQGLMELQLRLTSMFCAGDQGPAPMPAQACWGQRRKRN